MSTLSFGKGMYADREVRTCARCGAFTDVLVSALDPETGVWRKTSGRGRCPECGSQALRTVDEAELPFDGEETVVCPLCGGPLAVQPAAIWD